MKPRAFVSYAGEDKGFVLPFAIKLRSEMGVDAWVAEWEIGSGDSLVRKIFDEGLGKADAVIIVLSNHSVDKPWVRAELDVAKVREIEEQTKLIPVVLDDCEIPMALRALRRERIRDLHDYDAQLKRIVMAVNGMYERPPLAEGPAYAQVEIRGNSGLTKVDALVLKLLCEGAIERGSAFVNMNLIAPEVEELQLPENEFVDAVEMLADGGYIVGNKEYAGAPRINAARITARGFEAYAVANIPEFQSLYLGVATKIEYDNHKTPDTIAAAIDQKQIIVEFILDMLESGDYITLSKSIGGIRVSSTSPKIRRMLQGA